MERLLDEAVEKRQAGPGDSPECRPEGEWPGQRLRRFGVWQNQASAWQMVDVDVPVPVVVVGAGPTGLSAAYHLGQDALLLEQNDRVGGVGGLGDVGAEPLAGAGILLEIGGQENLPTEPGEMREMSPELGGDLLNLRDQLASLLADDLALVGNVPAVPVLDLDPVGPTDRRHRRSSGNSRPDPD
jgi:hypothetical protein